MLLSVPKIGAEVAVVAAVAAAAAAAAAVVCRFTPIL